MADGHDSGKSAGSGAPSADADGILGSDERKALLKRAVANQTREARANLQSQGDFEATIVRGHPINHRVHLVAVVVMAVLAVGVGFGFKAGLLGVAKAMVVPGAYALWWLFLTATGGEQLERLSIDERGKVSSVKSGRDVEARGDFVRVAIPLAVIALAGWIAVGLIHDIAFPPPPNCNLHLADQPDACLSLPNLSALMNSSADLSSTSPAPSASGPSASAPSASGAVPSSAVPSAAVSGTTPASGFTVEETKTLERVIRGFQLIVAVIALLASVWFVRRMRTGRWVGFIRPVHHRPSDG